MNYDTVTCSDVLYFNDQSKTHYSRLCFQQEASNLDLTQPSPRKHLNRLDELEIKCPNIDVNQMLVFCSRFRTLRLCSEKFVCYEEFVLPIIRLVLEGELNTINFPNHFFVSAPHSGDARLNANTDSVALINMPSTSLNSL
ncbi:hypothetical protein EDC96DRAFT_566017 [Choanephora cucurbitarum]|nr:hypothetical protein EDC96DRAFT_566017 [Choanephora cucurbitarum]